MKKKLRNLSFILMVFICSAQAQTAGWHYQASIDSIKESGFYNLFLTPQINANLKTDYSDLRIINESGKWVPHLLRHLSGEYSDDMVIWDLQILKKETNPFITNLIVKNKDSVISNLVLFLNNTVAERFCSVSGSNDLKSWFTINDSILIKPENSMEKDNSIFYINFPPSGYKYFRIQINNREQGPYNIKKVGTSSNTIPTKISGPYPPIENPATAIFQKDSARSSYIKITQTASYHFNELHLLVSGAKYFNRNADLYIPASNNHSFNNPGQLIHAFTISNNSTLQFKLPWAKATIFYLIVHNEDNLPIKVDAVKTFFTKTVATAYLEKGTHYRLLTGNFNALQPVYDLKQFDKGLEPSVPAIGIDAIEAIAPMPVVSTSPGNQWMIWLIIVLAGGLLAFFAYKLLTEMNKPTTQA